MTDETVEADESVEEAAMPSLDEIASEFNVDEQVSTFQAKPEPREVQQYYPDPISDPEQFNQLTRQQQQAIENMNRTVSELNQKLSAHENKLVQQQVEADIERAVAKVNTKLDVDPKMAEIALRMEYEKNPSFQKIWDNRSKNPKAFEKALDAVANQYSSVFSVRQDPQLTENQLAAKKSLQTMNKKPPEPDSKWENMSQSEFEREWDAARRG